MGQSGEGEGRGGRGEGRRRKGRGRKRDGKRERSGDIMVDRNEGRGSATCA